MLPLVKLKVSVVLCVFNGASFLRQQLDSIAMQTVQPDELIIRDDCSIDSTVDIAFEFKRLAAFPVIIKINEANLGYLKNFELSAAAAKYDLVFLCDQDDIWNPDKISVFVDAFNADGQCGYIFSDAVLIDSENNVVGENLWPTIGFGSERREKYSAGKQLEVMLNNGNFVYGNGLAFRNKYRELIYPMPLPGVYNVISHDVWIASLLSLTGAYGIALNRTCYAYRQHSEQVVGASMECALSQDVIVAQRIESIDLYQALLDRTCNAACDRESRVQIKEKIRHFKVRIEISRSKFARRLFLVSRELIAFRYFRFSSGILSALKDLFLGASN